MSLSKSTGWTTGITFRHSESFQQNKNNKLGQAGSWQPIHTPWGLGWHEQEKVAPDLSLESANTSRAAEEVIKLPRWHYPGNALTAAATGNISQEGWGCRKAGTWRPLIYLLVMNDGFATISHRSLSSQLLLGLLCREQELHWAQRAATGDALPLFSVKDVLIFSSIARGQRKCHRGNLLLQAVT